MPKLPTKPTPRVNETTTIASIRQAIASRHDSRVWRNNTGAVFAHGTRIQYGLGVGSPDLVGVVSTWLKCPHCSGQLPPIGRFVGIEVKAAERPAPLSDDQVLWAEVARRYGAVVGVAHSASEAEAILDCARGDWGVSELDTP